MNKKFGHGSMPQKRLSILAQVLVGVPHDVEGEQIFLPEVSWSGRHPEFMEEIMNWTDLMRWVFDGVKPANVRDMGLLWAAKKYQFLQCVLSDEEYYNNVTQYFPEDNSRIIYQYERVLLEILNRNDIPTGYMDDAITPNGQCVLAKLAENSSHGLTSDSVTLGHVFDETLKQAKVNAKIWWDQSGFSQGS